MNSIITDENYNKQLLLNKYDAIITKSIVILINNLKAEKAAGNKNPAIYIGGIERNDLNSEYMIKIAKMCSSYIKLPIYVETSFLNYLRIKKENKTYTFKKLRKNKKVFKTHAEDCLVMIKENFKDIYTDNILKDIYNEFWNKKEINESEEE